jgi:hypothetical protein
MKYLVVRMSSRPIARFINSYQMKIKVSSKNLITQGVLSCVGLYTIHFTIEGVKNLTNYPGADPGWRKRGGCFTVLKNFTVLNL